MLRRLLVCVSFLALGAFGSLQAQSSSQLSRSDQDFAKRAFQINQAEIQMGRLASRRSTNNDVKQYAQQMVDDHTKANDQLQQIASSKGITFSSNLDPRDRAILNRLRNASGTSFDREFAQDQMMLHKQALSFFQNEANKGTDPDLKNWASNELSGLQNHESMASNLYSELSGTPAAQGRSEYGTQPSSNNSSSSSSSASSTSTEQNNTNGNQTLPRTASNMPLFGLFGLLVIAAALIMRSFRLLRGTR